MQSDLIEQIAKQARRLRVGRTLPDGELTWEQLQGVRNDFERMLAQPNITIDRVAHAMGEGYSRGSLSRFRNLQQDGDRNFDAQRIARALNKLMETAARRGAASQTEGFVETAVARRMLTVIAKTQEIGGISIIYGDAGRGKTMTLKAAAAIHPGSILIRVMRSTRAPATLAKALAKALSIRGVTSILQAETKVIERLAGSRRLIMVDEAHALKPDALKLLRDIVDEAGVSLVLCGTWKIGEAVADSDVFSGQFSSRVLLRFLINESMEQHGNSGPPLHSVAEIRELFERDKVRFAPDGLNAIFKLANAPGLGGLRLVSKVVTVAAGVADGAIDGALIRRVLRTLQGRAYADQVFERQLQERAAVGIA